LDRGSLTIYSVIDILDHKMGYAGRSVPTGSNSMLETSFNAFADAFVATLAPHFEVLAITAGRSVPLETHTFLRALDGLLCLEELA
jgi:hypothetical protein